MIMFEKGELIQWVRGKESKAGSASAKTPETETISVVSTSTASRRSSRREREILERLRPEQHSSTLKLFPVGEH
jgi:hypothetical protein